MIDYYDIEDTRISLFETLGLGSNMCTLDLEFYGRQYYVLAK